MNFIKQYFLEKELRELRYRILRLKILNEKIGELKHAIGISASLQRHLFISKWKQERDEWENDRLQMESRISELEYALTHDTKD